MPKAYTSPAHEDSPLARISGKIYTTADVAHGSSAVSLPPSLGISKVRHLGAEIAAEKDVVAGQILVNNRLGVEKFHTELDIKEYLHHHAHLDLERLVVQTFNLNVFS